MATVWDGEVAVMARTMREKKVLILADSKAAIAAVKNVVLYTRSLLLSPYVMFSIFLYYDYGSVITNYIISFFLLSNVYGFSSFHIYPVTYLFLLITRGHGYSFINIPFYCFLILLGYGFLVSQTTMPFVYLSLFSYAI